MKLQDYRKLRGISRARFGALVGITGIQIWRIETGRSFPTPPNIKKIWIETGGAVTANDHAAAVEAARIAKGGSQ